MSAVSKKRIEAVTKVSAVSMRVEEFLASAEQSLVRGDFVRAISQAQEAVQRAPDNAKAWRLLGAAMSAVGRRTEAVAALERAVAISPGDAIIQNSLGAALVAEGQRARAIDAFERATQLAPDLIQAWQNLASLLAIDNRPEESLVAIDHALERAPRVFAARIHRGAMLLALGREDESNAEYREVLRDNPAAVGAWLGLAGLKSQHFSSEDVEQLQRLRRDAALHERDRYALGFVLAQALDDHGRYADAFAVLDEANAGVRRILPWDAATASKEVDVILAAFEVPAPASSAQAGSEVIFIASLPRAGSTLIEQILASHAQVEGAGELDDLDAVIEAESRRRGSAFATWAPQISDADWCRLGRDYLARTARWRERKPWFTDKSLANWRYVGAVRRMLPGARIVLCSRDPLETALSCYRQNFGGAAQAWSYDVASIVAYMHDFDRASRRWLLQYPQAVRLQAYESLVAQPEQEIRALLEFCGLPFDSACLQFHKTQRAVNTLSASQVRTPIRSDTARAARYGASLDALRAALRE